MIRNARCILDRVFVVLALLKYSILLYESKDGIKSSENAALDLFSLLPSA